MSVFIDSNVLLYAASPDPAEREKHAIALGLLDRPDCVFSIQVLNEFVHQASRSSRPFPMSRSDALAVVRTLRRSAIQPVDLAVFDRAAELSVQTNYSWWDCLIVAAALVRGCDRLASEDLQHGRVIDGLTIENPFRDVA